MWGDLIVRHVKSMHSVFAKNEGIFAFIFLSCVIFPGESHLIEQYPTRPGLDSSSSFPRLPGAGYHSASSLTESRLEHVLFAGWNVSKRMEKE